MLLTNHWSWNVYNSFLVSVLKRIEFGKDFTNEIELFVNNYQWWMNGRIWLEALKLHRLTVLFLSKIDNSSNMWVGILHIRKGFKLFSKM